MAYLEAAKQDSFSPQTLGVWFDQMSHLKWTEGRFREKVLAVLRAPTYGRITFDMFLSIEPVPSAIPQEKCHVHKLVYVDGHCPKCSSATFVPMPEFVMKELRELEKQMKVQK